jgi:2-polyprenyl-3-methyl-5-hydroxy-6-metoxy-1,4-benzoquinol methylase
MSDDAPAGSEQSRVEHLSAWYVSEQLGFDRRLIAFRYESIRPHFHGESCLELGPADGEMTSRLVRDFERLTVVDGSAQLLQRLPNVPHLRKVHALFEDFVPEERFDTVVMEHILEHVDAPVELLRRGAQWLAPGGVLIAGVPNGHSFHRLVAVKMGMLQHPCELNERDHLLGHRRVYTPATFHADVRAAGLTIRASGGVFFKPLSNKQMEDSFSEALIQGFYELGKDFPDHAAELFVVCGIG